jgi:capsular polysaccharide biosynthesis protein
MNSSQRPDSFEPGDYLQVLRRRWWIVLVVAIIGLVLAAGYVKEAHKVYTASALVFVNATAANTSSVTAGRTTGGVDMDSQAQLVQSTTVVAAVKALLSSPLTDAQLAKKVTVTVPANSQVLQIGCDASTGDLAAACANDFAKEFISTQTTAAVSDLKNQVSTLQKQVTALGQSAATLSARISALPPNSSTRATDVVNLRSDNSQAASLSHQVGVLVAEEANSSAGSITSSAVAPAKPSSPQKILILPSGLVAGLLIGLIAAFLVDRRDKRIHNARDLERYLDLPVLLSVSAKKYGTQPSLVGPRSRTGQAFAELAHTSSAALGEGNHVMVVAGTSAGAGGGVTAANLAAALARTHAEVVLVCADLRGSVIPELFRLGQGRGLAEVLAGNATVSEVARRPADFPRLRVVTPGVDTSFALYNFQHDATRDLIAELRRSTPFVIIEAQATSEGGDTFALAEFADAALITVEVGKSTRPQVADCLQRLDRLRTTVLGAALIPPFSAPARSAAGRTAEYAESPAGPAERRPRPPGRRPEPGERHPENGGTQKPAVKVGPRDPTETWPLPPGSVRMAADKRGRTPRPAGEREDPVDKNTGS